MIYYMACHAGGWTRVFLQKQVRWALAGRNKEKLDNVRKELQQFDPNAKVGVKASIDPAALWQEHVMIHSLLAANLPKVSIGRCCMSSETSMLCPVKVACQWFVTRQSRMSMICNTSSNKIRMTPYQLHTKTYHMISVGHLTERWAPWPHPASLICCRTSLS